MGEYMQGPPDAHLHHQFRTVCEKYCATAFGRSKPLTKLLEDGRSLRRLFYKFDKNRDGVVDFREFKRMLIFELHLKIRESDMDKLFTAYDSSQTGNINFAEFEEAFSDWLPDQAEEVKVQSSVLSAAVVPPTPHSEAPLWSEHPMYHQPDRSKSIQAVAKEPISRPSSAAQAEPKRGAQKFPRVINTSRSLSSVQSAKTMKMSQKSNAVKLASLKKGKDKRSFSILLAGASVLPPSGSVPIAFTPQWLHTSTALKAQTGQWAGLYPTVCNNYYPPVLKLLFAKEVLMFMNREFDLQAKLMTAWTKDDPQGGIKQLRKSTIVQLRERNPSNLKECMESLYEIVTGGPAPPPGFLLPKAHGGLWHLSALSMWRGSFPVLTGEFGKMLAEVQELQGKDYAPDTGQVQREFKTLTRRTTRMSTEAYIAAMKITDCVLTNLCVKEVHPFDSKPEPMPLHMKADAQHAAWFLDLVKLLQPGIGLYSPPALHYVEAVAVAALTGFHDIGSATQLLDKASDVRGLVDSDVRGWYSLHDQVQRLCVRQIKKLMFSKLKRPKEKPSHMTGEEMEIVWKDTTQYIAMVAAGFGVEIMRPTYAEYEEKRLLNAISQELDVAVALGPKSRVEGAMQLLLNVLLLPGVARPTATEKAAAVTAALALEKEYAKKLEEDEYWTPDEVEEPAPPAERLLATDNPSDDTSRMFVLALKLLPQMNSITANVAPVWAPLVPMFLSVCGEEAVVEMLRELMESTIQGKVARVIRDAFAIVEITLPHLTAEWKPSVINKMGAQLPYAHMLGALDVSKVWGRVCLQCIPCIGEKKSSELVTRFLRRSLSLHITLWLDAEKICREPKCRTTISQDLPLPGPGSTGENKWKKCWMDNVRDAVQLSKNRIEVTDLKLQTHREYLDDTKPSEVAGQNEEQPVLEEEVEDTRDPAEIAKEKAEIESQMLKEYVRVDFNLLPSQSKKDTSTVTEALAALNKILAPPESSVWRGRNYKDELESQILTAAIDRSKPLLSEHFDGSYVETAISFGEVTAYRAKADDSVAENTLNAVAFYKLHHGERIEDREERIELEEEKQKQLLAGTYVAEEEDSDDEGAEKEPEVEDPCNLTFGKLEEVVDAMTAEKERAGEGKRVKHVRDKRLLKRKKREDVRVRIRNKRNRLSEIDGCAERGEDVSVFDREVQGIKKYLTLTPLPDADTESDGDDDDDPVNSLHAPSAVDAYFYSRTERYADNDSSLRGSHAKQTTGTKRAGKGGGKNGRNGSIFISFNWCSWSYAKEISEAFENQGYRIIGRDSFKAMHGPVDEQIESALKSVGAIIVLATRSYMLSYENMMELNMADEFQLPMVPVLLEDPADVTSWNYSGNLAFPVSRFGKICERNNPVRAYQTINPHGQDRLPGHVVVDQCAQLIKAVKEAKAAFANKKASSGVLLPQSASTILSLGKGAR
jgi:hypothetical protein